MADYQGIKRETGYLGVKPDPDAKGMSPGAMDEDVYEDDGELEYNMDPNANALYMAKVPKYLWERWATLDDDAEIHIGTIRQRDIKGPNGQIRVGILSVMIVMTLLLTSQAWPLHASLFGPSCASIHT